VTSSPNSSSFLVEMLGEFREFVAMPEEVSVVPKALHRPHDEFTPAPGGYLPWTEARKAYDALLVLDSANVWGTGVSVLARRESTFLWELALDSFPVPPDPDDPDFDERSLALSGYLARRLTGVSPAPSVGNGELAASWRCNTLRESLLYMLYLDAVSRAGLRECGLQRCTRNFRPGPWSATYCSEKCTSAATTRRWREEES
jgi:hypothetical protein